MGRRPLPSICWSPLFSYWRFLPCLECHQLTQGLSLCLSPCYNLCTDTSHTNLLRCAGVCGRCLSGVTPAVKAPFYRIAVRGSREHLCVGLVTSNCLVRFDAHNEQIGLNLDKINVFKPFLLSCFIWPLSQECSVTVGLTPPFSKHFSE